MPRYIQLSDHFTYHKLTRFTWPTVIMMVFSALYGVVDGVMVSNFVGKTPFAALNLIWPFVGLLSAFGFMFGTGGSALVAKTLGEGKRQKADEIFSFITYTLILFSLLLGLGGLLFLDQVAMMLGAEGEMLILCAEYATPLLICLPVYALQIYFQSFLVTAERPKTGMWVMVAAGVTNILLDYLFIAVWHWGLKGAAWATATSYMVGGLIPLSLFIFKKKDDTRPLRLVAIRRFGQKIGFYARSLVKVAGNGLSEFVMNISLQVVSMLYMVQLMQVIGENGVAAYGVIMYFAWIFVSFYLGYSVGVSPVVSYHYGAENKQELSSLLRKSLVVMAFLGVGVLFLSQWLTPFLASIFVGYDPDLMTLTIHAFRIYGLHFLVTGLNIYASSFFTALNNGVISALISLSRTLIFECACVLILPKLFGIEGIWWAVVVAELISCVLSATLLYIYRRKYGYSFGVSSSL